MQEAGKEIDNKAYFVPGLPDFTTDSPFLVSNSAWLNDPVVRDFVARHALRRNHVAVPTTFDITEAMPIVKPFFAKNIMRIETLFQEERRKNPALDAWFEERFISDLTVDSLKGYPKGSVGELYYRYVTLNNFRPDFTEGQPVGPTQLEYFLKRLSQQHDLEHILGGFSFHFFGETGVTYIRVASYFKYLSPELAGLLNTTYTLLLGPLAMRTWLHYPETFNTFYDVVHQGMTVGRLSEPVFMMKYEPVLHLPVAEAREAIGYRGVVEDSPEVREMADIWGENVPTAIDPRLHDELAVAAE